MLLFGKDRERHFPDAWIQAGRFRGTDKTKIADGTEIRLHLPQAVEAAIGFVQKHASLPEATAAQEDCTTGLR